MQLTANAKMNLVDLRSLKPGEAFYRIRGDKLSAYQYTKGGYNRPNKALGYKASFTCGREDDISYSVELKPGTEVLKADWVELNYDCFGAE